MTAANHNVPPSLSFSQPHPPNTGLNNTLGAASGVPPVALTAGATSTTANTRQHLMNGQRVLSASAAPVGATPRVPSGISIVNHVTATFNPHAGIAAVPPQVLGVSSVAVSSNMVLSPAKQVPLQLGTSPNLINPIASQSLRFQLGSPVVAAVAANNSNLTSSGYQNINSPQNIQGGAVLVNSTNSISCTSSVGNGAVTTPGSAQKVKVEDALTYLDHVKSQFGSSSVYNDFLEIMKQFKSQIIDTTEVIQRVSELFKGHGSLITGFNAFLPPGYQIRYNNGNVQVVTPSEPFPAPVASIGLHVTCASNTTVTTTTSASVALKHDNSLSNFPSVVPVPGAAGVYSKVQQSQKLQRVLPPAVMAPFSSKLTTAPLPTNSVNSNKNSSFRGTVQMPAVPLNLSASSPSASMTAAAVGTSNSRTFLYSKVSKERSLSGDILYPYSSEHNAKSSKQVLEEKTESAATEKVEFNRAVSYVSKIKSRFSEEPHVYDKFMEILKYYKNDQEVQVGGELKRQVEKELFNQVSALFKNDKELIEEFVSFLPEVSEMFSAQKSVRRPMSAGGHGNVAPSIEHPTKELASSAGGTRHRTTSLGLGGSNSSFGGNVKQNVPQHVSHYPASCDIPRKRAKMSVENSANVEKFSLLNTRSEFAMFDEIRNLLLSSASDDSAYKDFVKCIAVLNLGIIDKREFLQIVRPLFVTEDRGRSHHSRTAFNWLRDFLGLSGGSNRSVVKKSPAVVKDEVAAMAATSEEDEDDDDDDDTNDGRDAIDDDGDLTDEFDGAPNALGCKVEEKQSPAVLKGSEASSSKVRHSSAAEPLPTLGRPKFKTENTIISSPHQQSTFKAKGLTKSNNDYYEAMSRREFVQGGESGKNETPIGPVDLSQYPRYGISYRILPKDEMLDGGGNASGPERLEPEVAACINTQYRSVAFTTGESSSYVSPNSRKKYSLDYMSRIDDERFELDMLMEVNCTAMNCIEYLHKVAGQASSSELVSFDLRRLITTAKLACIKSALSRIYGDKWPEVFESLFDFPQCSLAPVLARLRERDEHWRKNKLEFNKVWNSLYQKHSLRALDMKSSSYKAADLKTLKSKALIAEIEQTRNREEQQSIHYIPSVVTLKSEVRGKLPKPHLELSYDDKEAIVDADRLIIYYLKRNISNRGEKSRMKKILKHFLKDLSSLERGELSDDEVSSLEDDESESATVAGDDLASTSIDQNDNQGKHLIPDPSHALQLSNNLNNEQAGSSGQPHNQNTSTGNSVTLEEHVGQSEVENIPTVTSTTSTSPHHHLPLPYKKPGAPPFLCTNSWFLFFRLHVVLSNKLASLKRLCQLAFLAQKNQPQPRPASASPKTEAPHPQNRPRTCTSSTSKNNAPFGWGIDDRRSKEERALATHGEGEAAVQLGLKKIERYFESVDEMYEELIEAICDRMDNKIEAAQFEDLVRLRLGLNAYEIFTADRFIHATAQHLHKLVTNPDNIQCFKSMIDFNQLVLRAKSFHHRQTILHQYTVQLITMLKKQCNVFEVSFENASESGKSEIKLNIWLKQSGQDPERSQFDNVTWGEFCRREMCGEPVLNSLGSASNIVPGSEDTSTVRNRKRKPVFLPRMVTRGLNCDDLNSWEGKHVIYLPEEASTTVSRVDQMDVDDNDCSKDIQKFRVIGNASLNVSENVARCRPPFLIYRQSRISNPHSSLELKWRKIRSEKLRRVVLSKQRECTELTNLEAVSENEVTFTQNESPSTTTADA
ncbi:paired amphipathic helix protein Sin3a-like [Convolutriloba macropyga]|uniref:paired amphipathic helix protein Sin3a-like n=1 Tax=Convolutriloba macropyga TaxID=536237 RepID=UPI003F524906